MPNSLLNLYSANDLGYEENTETTKKLYLRRAEIDKNTGSYYITSKILPS
jgi:hypothetical protein